MTAHDWYLKNRVGFATRSLEEREEAIFADHVSRCEECRVAVAELERDLAWLPMGVASVAPRPGLTRSIMERVLRRPRTRWWQWGVSFAAAASLLLAVGVWTETRREISALRRALDVRQGRLITIEDSLSPILGAERVLQKTIKGQGSEGGVLIFYDQDTQRWNVVAQDLPPARTGEGYQLWFVTSRGLLPGPELRANGSRPTLLTVRPPAPFGDTIGAALVVGPVGSDRPRGVELARFKLSARTRRRKTGAASPGDSAGPESALLVLWNRSD